jgi:tetrahydrodipicolinate N-succinyltransferase
VLGPTEGPELKLGDELGDVLPDGALIEEASINERDEIGGKGSWMGIKVGDGSGVELGLLPVVTTSSWAEAKPPANNVVSSKKLLPAIENFMIANATEVLSRRRINDFGVRLMLLKF